MEVDSCLIPLSFLLFAAIFFLRAIVYDFSPKKIDKPRKYEFRAYGFLVLVMCGLTILYWGMETMSQSSVNRLPILLLFLTLVSALNYRKYIKEMRIFKK